MASADAPFWKVGRCTHECPPPHLQSDFARATGPAGFAVCRRNVGRRVIARACHGLTPT